MALWGFHLRNPSHYLEQRKHSRPLEKDTVPRPRFSECWLKSSEFGPPVWCLLTPAESCAHDTFKFRNGMRAAFASSGFLRMLGTDVGGWETHHS